RRDTPTSEGGRSLQHAAAGHAVETGLLQTSEYLFVGELRDEVDVMYLGRREAMELEVRVARVERAQKVFVPLDAEVRVEPALHEHAGAAEREGLVDALADVFERADVRVGLARPPVEGAEGADDVADVRVVDVAV